MAGLLSIGLTGLNAAQSQLSTTSHNITNAATPGYHRQSVIQTTQEPLFSGVGFFGNGTRISAVSRSYDQYLEAQVMSADNRRAEYSAYNMQISQINNMLADPNTGLSVAMDGFFSGVQEVATNPTSTGARQAMISSAQVLVGRFQMLDGHLDDVRKGVETQLASTVDQINSYATAIGEMNRQVVIAQAAGAGVPANDLLDQRGQLVTELNKLIKTSTVAQSDGSISVFIGSGQNLVGGYSVSQLTTVPSPNDPLRSSIALVAPNGSEVALPERLLTGGELAGLLAFRAESLDPAQNRLGLIALSMSTAFNEQHKLGIDLDGMLGQDFFTLSSPLVQPSGAATVAIDPASIGNLTDSDYELVNTSGTLSLRRLNDGTVFAPSGVPPEFNVDGLSISGVTLVAGESALIQPTRYTARDIGLGIADTRKVAAGGPVSGNVPIANAGNGRLENIVVADTSGMVTAPGTVPNFAPITLSFDSSTNTFAVPAGFTLTPDNAFDPATQSVGKTFTLTGTTAPALFEVSFTVAGSPADGDAFTLQPTDKGVADNRNASLLGALQTAKLLFNAGTGAATAATATLGNAYTQMVSSIGNKTREVQVNEATQESLLTQATDARDSLSGVNLDEEAANLVRYQQAYQAAGRVMSVAQRLFDEVLSFGR